MPVTTRPRRRYKGTPRRAWKNPVLATVVIAGLVGFLWPIVGLMDSLTVWEADWNQPRTAATLLRSTIAALIAIGGASGLTLPSWPGRAK